MSEGEGITREVSLGELVARTIQLYRRDFSRYLVLFVVVEAITGVLIALVRRAIVVQPAVPANATPQQALNSIPGFIEAATALVVLSLVVSWVFYPLALGGAIKMASDEITTGSTSLAASVRFAASRMLQLWGVTLVFGILVFAGLLALVFPGIILSIMFSLAIPVVVIEGTAFESLGRSRRLVDDRWLKTLALLILLGITFAIVSLVLSAITGTLGAAGPIVSSIISSLYLPLSPIALTVYYYSNAARIATLQPAQAPRPMTAPQAGMKFCPSCGTQMASAAKFCPSCGTKQPA